MSNFTTGWQLLVLGMGTVFLMLYLLSVILKSMGKYLGPKKTPVQPIQQVSVTTEDQDEKAKKVAAVMAAIQMIMGDTDYKVISIKPTGSSTWKQSLNLGGSDYIYGGRKGT